LTVDLDQRDGAICVFFGEYRVRKVYAQERKWEFENR
jgi:hypothetical protein